MVQAERSEMQNIAERQPSTKLRRLYKASRSCQGLFGRAFKRLSLSRDRINTNLGKRENEREIREQREIWEIINKTLLFLLSLISPLSNSPVQSVNLLVSLVKQANYLLDKLILSLKKKQMKECGFSENLLKKG